MLRKRVKRPIMPLNYDEESSDYDNSDNDGEKFKKKQKLNDQEELKDNDEDGVVVNIEEYDYRDSGYSNNDDYCAKCLIDGYLICCDTCTLAWHLDCACLTELPKGNWSCPVCKESIVDQGVSNEDEQQLTSAAHLE